MAIELNELNIFQLSDQCIVIYTIVNSEPTFIRIGTYPQQTPFLSRNIKFLILSDLINLDYDKESDFWEQNEEGKIVSLPYVFQHYTKRIEQKNHFQVQLNKFPLQLSKLPEEYFKNQPKTKILFFSDGGVKLIRGEEVYFDLKKYSKEQRNIKYENELKRLYAFMGIINCNKQLGNIALNVKEIIKAYKERNSSFFQEAYKGKLLQFEAELDGFSEIFSSSFSLSENKRQFYFEESKVFKVGDFLEFTESSKNKRIDGRYFLKKGAVISSKEFFSYEGVVCEEKPEALTNLIVTNLSVNLNFYVQQAVNA